ncbi:MAG: xanthine dehydrogenase family protein subunit M [Alphaproteobacteria bacterium]|nr:xanthine dehydrogenase family protein subunit M [Alphaproteobacteria bacterium]MBU0799130.1 xanthine dehydrogenase family protein subunit M [Alphaproteobacteria bacterium]MBU0888841.1 xanthine dehydrogenase family protein subunit M [Alphaproteobacteria bacterium]MBU1813861.1 xanthine dehydrogenase family protein subunit M [Alphaproteobacteria bacterium]
MSDGRYLRPERLDEAVYALQGGGWTLLAGGTDYFPGRVIDQSSCDILDLTALPGLRGIADQGDHLRIGALTSWTDIIEAPLPPCFDGLKLAAREVGGMQIQNRGTIAGNLCNASPAADGVPPLLTLDASVELSSAEGVRVLSLSEFILGNRRTARRPDELMTAILVPKPAYPARATFLKLGARRYLVISIVMVAGVLEVTDGLVSAARIAVGACSAVAQRLPLLEAALIGQKADAALAERVTAAHLAGLAPIDDIRADAEYRLDAALVLTRRCLALLGNPA